MRLGNEHPLFRFGNGCAINIVKLVVEIGSRIQHVGVFRFEKELQIPGFFLQTEFLADFADGGFPTGISGGNVPGAARIVKVRIVLLVVCALLEKNVAIFVEKPNVYGPVPKAQTVDFASCADVARFPSVGIQNVDSFFHKNSPGNFTGKIYLFIMNGKFEEALNGLFENAIAEGIFSKAVVGFVSPGGFDVRAFGTPEDSLFDIASVTKVCPTSTLALKRILEGRLDLDSPVLKFIPELRTNYREEILVRHLLTHSLDYRVPMSSLKDFPPEKILESLFTYHFKRFPGTVFNYGNPASVLLGIVLMRLSGKSLSDMAECEIFGPLGMERSGWDPLRKFPKGEIVATEEDAWRGRTVQGEIHDESAFVLRKFFPVGSAGMFSTVPDLLKFVQMILGDGESNGCRIMPAGVLKMVSTNALSGRVPGACTALGWELDAEKFMGRIHGPRMFGKTGFTGSSIVADAESKRAVVLLSNFTYPHREPSAERINAFRSKLSDLTFGNGEI